VNRFVQWGVVLGILWAIFIAVVGNWATQSTGQTHGMCFIPEIWTCVVVLGATHAVAGWRLTGDRT
jgi:hypothetical protein